MARHTQGALLWAIRREQGRLAELEPLMATRVERFPDEASYRACHARTLVAAGRPEQARAQLRRLASGGVFVIPRDRSWVVAMTNLAEVGVLLGDRRLAAACYELLVPFKNYWVAFFFITLNGPVAFHLGRLARLLGDLAGARAHFATAAQMSRRADAPRWLAHAQDELSRLDGLPPREPS